MPWLAEGAPLAVQQHQDIIAVSHSARALGVRKHMAPSALRRDFPSVAVAHTLVLDGGKVSYQHYREASARVFEALRAAAPRSAVVARGRHGLDEFFVDLTSEASRSLAAPNCEASAERAAAKAGCVVLGRGHQRASPAGPDSVVAPSSSEPFASPPASESAWPGGAGRAPGRGAAAAAAAAVRLGAAAGGADAVSGAARSAATSELTLLLAASALAAKMRAAVRAATGFTASCGVAGNMLVAKLACVRAKPDGIACLPLFLADAALNPAALPIRRLPALGGGEGGVAAVLEREAGCRTVAEGRALPLGRLVELLGESRGRTTYQLLRWSDSEEVSPRGPPAVVASQMALTPFVLADRGDSHADSSTSSSGSGSSNNHSSSGGAAGRSQDAAAMAGSSFGGFAPSSRAARAAAAGAAMQRAREAAAAERPGGHSEGGGGSAGPEDLRPRARAAKRGREAGHAGEEPHRPPRGRPDHVASGVRDSAGGHAASGSAVGFAESAQSAASDRARGAGAAGPDVEPRWLLPLAPWDWLSARRFVRVLALDLAGRVLADAAEHSRWPSKLAVGVTVLEPLPRTRVLGWSDGRLSGGGDGGAALAGVGPEGACPWEPPAAALGLWRADGEANGSARRAGAMPHAPNRPDGADGTLWARAVAGATVVSDCPPASHRGGSAGGLQRASRGVVVTAPPQQGGTRRARTPGEVESARGTQRDASLSAPRHRECGPLVATVAFPPMQQVQGGAAPASDANAARGGRGNGTHRPGEEAADGESGRAEALARALTVAAKAAFAAAGAKVLSSLGWAWEGGLVAACAPGETPGAVEDGAPTDALVASAERRHAAMQQALRSLLAAQPDQYTLPVAVVGIRLAAAGFRPLRGAMDAHLERSTSARDGTACPVLPREGHPAPHASSAGSERPRKQAGAPAAASAPQRSTAVQTRLERPEAPAAGSAAGAGREPVRPAQPVRASQGEEAPAALAADDEEACDGGSLLDDEPVLLDDRGSPAAVEGGGAGSRGTPHGADPAEGAEARQLVDGARNRWNAALAASRADWWRPPPAGATLREPLAVRQQRARALAAGRARSDGLPSGTSTAAAVARLLQEGMSQLLVDCLPDELKEWV